MRRICCSNNQKTTLLCPWNLAYLVSNVQQKTCDCKGWGSCLCKLLDIFINMKIKAGPSILICSKARVCSKAKRHADLREVQLSCPMLTFLHKLQGYEVFSILLPNGRREKNMF